MVKPTRELRKQMKTLRWHLTRSDFMVFNIARRHRLSALDMMIVPSWNKTDAIWVHPGKTGKNIAFRLHGSSISASHVIRRHLPKSLPVVIWKRPMKTGDPERNWGQFLTRDSLREARRLRLPV